MKDLFLRPAAAGFVLFCCCLSVTVQSQCLDYPWARAGNGLERDEAWDIGTDMAGNTYMGGWFDSDAINFGSGVSAVNSAASQNGNGDAFLVKFSPDGTPLWSRSAGGSSNSDWAWAMAAVPDGGAVLGGEFFSTSMSFGSGITISNSGLSNAIISR